MLFSFGVSAVAAFVLEVSVTPLSPPVVSPPNLASIPDENSYMAHQNRHTVIVDIYADHWERQTRELTTKNRQRNR